MKFKQAKSANLPGAWVCNPTDKGRKSIKGDKIYLENNQEFEIEIYNPLKESVLADIRLNGNSISKTGLVVKPGQRIYLDCFIDDKKKFIFQTYQVENTQENSEAISNNGTLEVFFYKEEAVSIQNWNDKFHKIVIHEYYPVYYPWYYPYHYPYYGTTGGQYYGTTGGYITTNGGNYNTTTNIGTTFNAGSTFTSGDNSYGFSANCLNVQSSDMFNDISGEITIGKIETGRVEKGEKSNQQFTEVNMDFEKNYIHHIVYQLLPSSRKPNEIKNVYKKVVNESASFDLLFKLKDLKDAGILTEDEYDKKKKEILSRI